MNHFLHATFAALISLSLLAPNTALAAGKKSTQVESAEPAVKKPKKARKAKAAKEGGGAKTAQFDRGSEETKTQRKDRLKAECKGKVNAGACEGLTR